MAAGATARLAIGFSVVVAVVFNLVNLAGAITYHYNYIIPRIGYSLEEKHGALWGDYWTYMQLIRDNTPEDARILFPPRHRRYRPFEPPWRSNYFLCPRELWYWGEGSPSRGRGITPTTLAEIDYVLIYRDFPDFPVEGEKIRFDDRLGLYRIGRERPAEPPGGSR
jgi:hypothetical protein